MIQTGDSKRLLVLAFSTLIGILLLIAIIGITQMQRVIEQSAEVTNDRARKIQLVLDINEVAIQRMLFLRALFTTKDAFDRDEVLLKFRFEPVKFIETRDQLLPLIEGEEERRLMDAIIKTATENYWIEDDIINAIEADELNLARQLLTDNQLGSVNGLLLAINHMIHYQEMRFRKEINRNNEHHQNSNLILLFLFAAGFFLSLIIAVIVFLRIQKMDQRQQDTLVELVNARDEALRAQQEAEIANQSKTEFLSSMSHELRTPLNAVIGFSQLLENENLSDDQQDNVSMINNAGQHLLAVINQLLDLSRIETGNLQLHLDKVNLNELLDTCKQIVGGLLNKHEVELYMPENSDELQEIEICTDKTRFKQVLLNIISNAIKYNHVGGRVDIAVEQLERERIKILVTDTGQGISEKKQKRLFQPFDRLGYEASNVEGSGIGLVISRNLIEKMQGEIGFTSIDGEGSTFWIEIPLKQQD